MAKKSRLVILTAWIDHTPACVRVHTHISTHLNHLPVGGVGVGRFDLLKLHYCRQHACFAALSDMCSKLFALLN